MDAWIYLQSGPKRFDTKCHHKRRVARIPSANAVDMRGQGKRARPKVTQKESAMSILYFDTIVERLPGLEACESPEVGGFPSLPSCQSMENA